MKYIILLLMIITLGCGEEKEVPGVPLQQLNTDNSNKYQYIFRDTIAREKEIEKKKAQDPFKD